MENNPIFNSFIFDSQYKDGLHTRFQVALPFKHLVIDDFLDPGFAQALLLGFPSLDSMKTHYSGINEKKAEDNDLARLNKCFLQLHEALSSVEFIGWLTTLTGIPSLHAVNDRLGYGLHQGGNRSFLDIHIDYNIHPITRLQRRLNFLIFLNPGWKEEWGGYLELWDIRSKKVAQSIAPVFNRIVIFECSEISYHGYSRITVPPDVTRKSYYQYYFTTPAGNIRYHDTIFRPMPGTSLFKRIAVPIKESLKNGVKKALLTVGLEKFLK
jgi:hypothetical protein